MLDFDWFSHKKFVANELNRLLPAHSFAEHMWKEIAEELHISLMECPFDEGETAFPRHHPVKALFILMSRDAGFYLDLKRLSDGGVDVPDECGVPLPDGLLPALTAAEQMAIYGFWLVTVHADCKGPMVGTGTNKYGWSREQLIGHQCDCVMLGYQALAYAQRLSSGQSARPDEIEKAKNLYFSDIGKKGSDALHGRRRDERRRVLEMWKSGNYLNKMDCARAAKKEGVVSVELQTARDWLQGARDPESWPAKQKK
ncbi:hypothetical protein [Paraburkholderia hospita]|uniref:hypothetical protein n=1 Tax=Paraburkholderia hospita TaxID=169430 RepID=UPI000B343763|nr:hypothetical protein [Paraburkholderia hospita]OUL92942.1 hypothetical protein CA601_11145 [Paraburkholderia hospita]